MLGPLKLLATQGQVVRLGFTAVFFGNDVINLKWQPCVLGWKLAILALALCPIPNEFDTVLLHQV